MSNYPLNNLTKTLNNPKILDYCKRMYDSFTTTKPPKSYDELYEAVRKNFPYQLMIEKPDAIVTVDNGFNAPLYPSFGLTINFDIRVTIQSKITYERHTIDLRSSIYTDFATDTPSPVNPYNDAAFKHLSERQISYVAEAVQQTVSDFVKAITIAKTSRKNNHEQPNSH